MASDRKLIAQRAPLTANYVVAYEGTTGQIPFDLLGEYTSKHLAEQAIALFLVKREESQAAKPKKSSGDVSGDTDSKQRV